MGKRVDLRENLKEINFLGPVDGEQGGNCTLLILSGGQQVVDPRRTKSVLTALGRIYARDLVSLRHEASRVLGRRQEMPLFLGPGVVLVPVRTRRALFKDQGATGYLVLDKVAGLEEIQEGPYRSRVLFCGGGEIKTLYGRKAVGDRLREAREVQYFQKELWGENRLDKENLLRETVDSLEAADLVWLMTLRKQARKKRSFKEGKACDHREILKIKGS